MSSRRGSGKAVLVFAVLIVLLTAGMMCYFSEKHSHIWEYLWETATSDFSENDAPFAGPIVELKDFAWYALEALAVLASAFLLSYLAGMWGVGIVLAGVLWFMFGYPMRDVSNGVLLLPFVSGVITGFLANREGERSANSRAYRWGVR